MSDTKHAPTPWRTDVECGAIYDAAGATVMASEWLSTADTLPKIVRAVNAHEALVRIAKAYRNLLRTLAHTEGEVAKFHLIEDFLALVEGKEGDK